MLVAPYNDLDTAERIIREHRHDLALVIVVWLTAAGLILRYRMAQKDARRQVKLVHTQRFLFFALIGLLVIGHFFAEFHL